MEKIVAGIVAAVIVVVCVIVGVLLLVVLHKAGPEVGEKEEILSTNVEGSLATRTYAAVQIGSGVQAQRTVSVDAAGGKAVTLVLTGLTKGMSVQERIPKSFAQNVSQIKFSRQPSQILEADPLIVWKFDEIVSGESINITYEVPTNLVDISDLLEHVDKTVVMYGQVTEIRFFGGYEPEEGTTTYYDMQDGVTITDATGSVYVSYYYRPPRAEKPDIGNFVTVKAFVSEYEGEPILVTTDFKKGFDYATLFPEEFESPVVVE